MEFNPIFRRTMDAASDICTFQNDLFTLLLDLAEGEQHNLLIALQRRHGLGLGQAEAYEVDLIAKNLHKSSCGNARSPPGLGCNW
ncbi:terpene synthase family protein [Streptomyces murinus]|uniref:terpene synthase family protein n=1 Tax=Streptomyces murinus TaxID=33900 RepID=UPI003803FFCE